MVLLPPATAPPPRDVAQQHACRRDSTPSPHEAAHAANTPDNGAHTDERALTANQTQVEMAKLAIALLAAPAAAFAPAAGRPGLAPLRNAFGVDATYPAFLPQGGVGGTGPMPGDDPMGVMPWEREAFSTVEADPSQLDSAFMAANGAALDAKLSKYSEAQRSELLGKKSDLEVLGMSDKDLDKFFNPPPPKAKK